MSGKILISDYNSVENTKMEHLPKHVTFFDTSLRDGEQMPGVSFTDPEKLKIAEILNRLGVDSIEAGFPINSKPEFEIVKAINQQGFTSHIYGLARALMPDVEVCIQADLKYIHIFISSSPIHLKYQVRKEYDEMLEMVTKTITHAKDHGLEVIFSPMDASRTPLEDLIEVCKIAEQAGASTLNIPDTVGVLHPMGTKRMFGELHKNVKARLSSHAHNDFGLAVANSLAAVEAGAEEVQVTLNGIGERGGNASLEQTVMGLEGLYNVQTNIKKHYLNEASKIVERATEVENPPWTPVVGANAFAHEAGIHAHGILSKPETFEPYNPETVGQRRRIVIGKHSGKASIEQAIRFLGFTKFTPEQLDLTVKRIKETAAQKKRLYDEDLIVISNQVLGESSTSHQKIKLVQLNVMSGSEVVPTASVILQVNGNELRGAALGNGPIDSAANAIRNVLSDIYDIRLKDFQLKSATGGTDALGLATIVVEDSDHNTFIGESASTDVIMASVQALIRAANDAVSRREKVDTLIGAIAGSEER